MNTSHSAALALAEEVPVALVFNGITHAVMMASPANLEDFALGFALTEGLLQNPSHAQMRHNKRPIIMEKQPSFTSR